MCLICKLKSYQVIALTHHPTGGLDYYADWETNVMVQYGSVICLHVMGHNHGDSFKVVCTLILPIP